MAFTVRDCHDLVRLLAEHPDWRAELRNLLLSEELLSLPQLVRELAEAQRRSEEQLARLAEAMTTLAEAQREGEARLARAMEPLDAIENAFRRTTDSLDNINDIMLELHYLHLGAIYFFRTRLRQPRLVSAEELLPVLEAHLSETELNGLPWLDFVVAGRTRVGANGEEVMMAVEVSSVVSKRDVERAIRRARLLIRAGYRAVPAVVGDQVSAEAQQICQRVGVVWVSDGSVNQWLDAVSIWTSYTSSDLSSQD